MMKHDVLVIGAGPTGLMLAAELAIAKVDVAIVERRTNQEVSGARAGGFHARSLEVLDQRGVVDRFLLEGQKMQLAGFARTPLDISDFPTRHNYGLALSQAHIERILAAWVSELQVPICRGREVTDVVQGDEVRVALMDGTSLVAHYVVGCDGGRSAIRKTAGIEFPGWDAAVGYILAEATTVVEPPWGLQFAPRGVHAIGKLDDGRRMRVVLCDEDTSRTEEPTLEDLRNALRRVYGSDFGIEETTWISRFSDMARQAATYRSGRILLAGDAAHVHSPLGGQGLNTGIQDAVNLGWKLAQVVHGTAPASLLDTYHAERHPVGAQVIQTTLAQSGLDGNEPRRAAARAAMTELLQLEAPRKHYAGLMSGLSVRYDLGGTHPLVGRRMPDLDLETASGPRRVFSLLHDATPVLLCFGATSLKVASVRRVHASYTGPWELPVLGAVEAPVAVLVRPDGYVAWAATSSDASAEADLAAAAARWGWTSA